MSDCLDQLLLSVAFVLCELQVKDQLFGSATGDETRHGDQAALLADVSVEYYSRLEWGNLAGASDSVLDALARSLQLDEAERAHLFDLAASASGPVLRSQRKPSRQWTPRLSLQLALDAITTGPAFVRNGRMDFLATNALRRAFYADLYADPQRPPNLARFQSGVGDANDARSMTERRMAVRPGARGRTDVPGAMASVTAVFAASTFPHRR